MREEAERVARRLPREFTAERRKPWSEGVAARWWEMNKQNACGLGAWLHGADGEEGALGNRADGENNNQTPKCRSWFRTDHLYQAVLFFA